MNQELLKFYRLLLFVTAGLAWLIVSIYGAREAAVNSAHVHWLATQNVAWAQADAARAINLARQISEREKELRLALGGPLGEATKNPELDIRHMLHDTAIACAPSGTEVSVNVDRFTEFDVAVILPQPLPVDRLAVISQALLQHTVPYVHSLRFIHGDNLLAYLGVNEIEAETNWNTVRSETVAWQLTNAGKQGQTVIAPNTSVVKDDAPPEEESTPAQAAIRKAQADFKIDYEEHVRQLNNLQQSLNLASLLKGIQSHNQFTSQMNSLAQTESDLAGLRTFFMNQSADLVLLLRDQGVDPLLVTIYQRGMDDDNAQEAPILDELFEAISVQLRQIRECLTTMDSYRGEWNVSIYTSRIQFTTTQAHDAYVNESSQVQTSAGLVRDAVIKMSHFKPTHAPATATP